MTSRTVTATCPTCNGSRRSYVAGGWGTCVGCGGSGQVTKTVYGDVGTGGGRGHRADAGTIAFLAAAPAAIASFFYAASFAEPFATRAIVAVVVFVAIYYTLIKPLRPLSSAIAAILNTIWAVVQWLVKIALLGAMAAGVWWLASTFFREYLT